MIDKPFPVLKLSTKRLVFWMLIISFSCYSFLIYTEGTNYSKGQEMYTENAEQGKLIFHKYNCISCHQIYGLGGYMGPDLTNVISSQAKGRLYAQAFIQAGTAKMPKFEMSEQEVSDLLDYLEYVGAAANYPITDFEATWYGDVRPNTIENE